jgi:hypothetical protein
VSAAPAIKDARPAPRLVRITPRSFLCERRRLDQLATWLAGRSWREYPPKGQHEFARFWRADALVILYRSGSVVAAGPNASQALAELASLCGVEEVRP